MEHLKEMAGVLHETAMGFRWLAALAGATGDSIKSSEVQNQADTLDEAGWLLDKIHAEFEAAEEAAAENPAPDEEPVEEVDDMEDDDELED